MGKLLRNILGNCCIFRQMGTRFLTERLLSYTDLGKTPEV